MTKELNDAVNELQKTFHDFTKSNKEEMQAAIKGYVDPLLKEKNEQLNAAMDKAEDAIATAEKAQSIAKAMRAIENNVEHKGSEDDKKHRKAFVEFIRLGEERMSHDSLDFLKARTKAMSSASDPAGGYVVVPQMDAEITRVLNETSPIRRYASVKTISSDQYERLQRTDNAGANWADRDVAPSESTTPTWKKLKIQAWRLEAEPQISQDLIDDAYIDIEAELMSSLTESFALAENSAFVNGDGVGQPRGFLDYTAGSSWGTVEQIVTGSAAALTYDGLVNLTYSIKEAFAARAVFMMRRTTVAAIRKLVDGNGDPLWIPGFGAEPATLMGYPVVRAADVPAVGADALAIAFGDFSQGYFIIDRLGTRVLRDPYTAKPFVKFFTTKRVGGGINNFEAIKIQKCHT
jgi:HK97 family phage major capsid protein